MDTISISRAICHHGGIFHASSKGDFQHWSQKINRLDREKYRDSLQSKRSHRCALYHRAVSGAQIRRHIRLELLFRPRINTQATFENAWGKSRRGVIRRDIGCADLGGFPTAFFISCFFSKACKTRVGRFIFK